MAALLRHAQQAWNAARQTMQQMLDCFLSVLMCATRLYPWHVREAASLRMQLDNYCSNKHKRTP